MNKSYCLLVTFLLSLVLSGTTMSAEKDTREQILDGLQQNLPDLNISGDQLSPTPIEGLWVLRIGPEVVYIDERGEHLIQGDLIHLSSRENLTENTRAKARKAALVDVGEEQKISYPAENEKYRLTVFTDIDCGYCRQMHRDMDELNAAGISVDYLFYPRGGPGSAAWTKSDQVWCSSDRNAAMDHAKSGGTPDADICEDTPTEAHYQLGRQMQVTGTPALITESGHMIRGYMPIDRLIAEIETREQQGN